MVSGFEILIVEDEANIASNLKQVLELEGYPATIAGDGRTALALCREKKFSLALVDLKLPDFPDTSELKLISELSKVSAETEYILITGYASLRTAAEAVKEKRIIAYETKPLNIEHILSLVRQVAERKRAEEMFRVMADSSPIGIYIVQHGSVQYVNLQLQKLSGFSQDKVLGKDPLSFVFSEDREMVRESAVKMLRGERSTPYEYRFVTKDGRLRWVMETVTSVHYRGERATLGSYMDITEHKIAEKALEAQKELTDRILTSMPNAVLVVDRDLDIILANRMFYDTFQIGGIRVEGRQLGEILPIKGLVEAVSKTLTNQTPQVVLEFQYQLESAEKILAAHIVSMGEEVLLILSDVTAERARQEQLYHVNRLASIGEVAAGVAHELNNPLAGVLGYSELLLARQDLAQDVKADVEVIYSGARRTVTIVRNLLTFARRQPPQKRYLNVNDIVKHVLEMRGYELKVSNIQIVTELADALPGVMADPQQLEQVFINIILNAEWAMSETHGRGTLTIRTGVRGDMVKIALVDDGPGIPAENMKRLFQPFFTTKAQGKGTGLGLSICHGIVTEHGGRIYAESKLGAGATFFVELPIVEGGKI